MVLKPKELTPEEIIAKAAKKETGDPAAAVPKKGGSPIEDAKETLAELKEQNKVMTENIKKQTELQTEMIISGKTAAGAPSMSAEEKLDEDARKLIEGSGFEEKLFPKKK